MVKVRYGIALVKRRNHRGINGFSVCVCVRVCVCVCGGGSLGVHWGLVGIKKTHSILAFLYLVFQGWVG